MPRQPLYPHIPKSQRTEAKSDLRFLPDSPEVLAQTANGTGYRDKIAQVFRQAIARVRGMR